MVKSEPIRIGGSCCKPKGRPGRKEGSSQVKAGLYYKISALKTETVENSKFFLEIPHTVENALSGFKSKNLNFFFGIYLYAVYLISIFRKCYLGNFQKSIFKKLLKSRSFSGLK